MNVFAKFGEIPSRTLQDIKKTKRFGHTFVLSFGRTDGRTDNVKTVYPPTNIVCGGIKKFRNLWAWSLVLYLTCEVHTWLMTLHMPFKT